MRKTLRRTLVAGGLSLFALVPVGTASAAARLRDQTHLTATNVTTPARLHQQDRLRLHQQDRLHQQVHQQDQDQQRQRLRDGSCADGPVRTGTQGRVSHLSGAEHRSGAQDGTRTPVRPLDGTGNQWHPWQLS